MVAVFLLTDFPFCLCGERRGTWVGGYGRFGEWCDYETTKKYFNTQSTYFSTDYTICSDARGENCMILVFSDISFRRVPPQPPYTYIIAYIFMGPIMCIQDLPYEALLEAILYPYIVHKMTVRRPENTSRQKTYINIRKCLLTYIYI